MVYCVHVNAGKKAGGTTRKGWVCYDADGYFRGFVKDLGRGRTALVAALNVPEAVALPGGRITTREYRDLLRDALN
tara:strand:+ start:5364 stop:5591 length:228 start_codon:yes stop_codon:yes gene_type:complete